jgi:hypothetical protein
MQSPPGAMDTPPRPIKEKKTLFDKVERLFAFIGALASIGAIVLFFFPQLVLPKRELCFTINESRTPIVQTAVVSKLTILHDGNAVNGDVTAVQIGIWNNGREGIKGTDLIYPFVISVPTNCPILEAELVKTVGSPVRLTLDRTQLSSGRLQIQWDLLEYKEGGLVQMIYSGGKDVPVFLQGRIPNQKVPKSVKPVHPFLAIAIANVMLVIAFLSLGFIDWRSVSVNRHRTALILSGLLATSIVLFTFAQLIAWRESLTPFSF